MNTLDNNKLIAEFMGMQNTDLGWYDSAEAMSDYACQMVGGNTFEELQYDRSWDWLMPVVKEMHTYGCEVVISSNGVTTIYAPSGEVLAEESSEEDDHMRDATYKAIVKVLKENLHKPC